LSSQPKEVRFAGQLYRSGDAKAFQEQPQTTLSNSPTLMSASLPGAILGTAAYMSPEQIKGRQVDRRTDIFAFGCVLYEMLTAKPTFGGDTVPDILSNVLKSEPDWKILPQRTPHTVHSLLRRCLQKDPACRLREAADAGIEIDQALADFDSQAEVTPAVVARSRSGRLGWVLVSIAIIALAVSSVYRPAAPPETRVQVVTPSDPLSPQSAGRYTPHNPNPVVHSTPAVVEPDSQCLAGWTAH